MIRCVHPPSGYLAQRVLFLIGYEGTEEVESMLLELFSPLLCILMLLGCVSKSQGLVKPHSCPPVGQQQGLPNCTVQAGTAFYFPLPLPATRGPLQHYQVSLANDDTIPRWLAFTEKTGKLFGLALREDCGQYPLKVSVAGHCVSITYFHLHVLNGTVGEGSLLSAHIKAGLVCPVGENVIWADLMLQVDPGSLDADQRVQLTSTMADYLRMAPGSVHLLSLRGPIALQREKTRVCRQDPQTADTTQGKGQGTLGRGQAAELLWPVGCGVGEQLSDLARILEHSTASGRLTTMLGVPILGWRVLCKGLLPRIRRGLQPLHHTATPTVVLPPPTQVPESVRLKLSHIPAPEPSTSLMMSYPTGILERHTGAPNLELTQASSYPLTSSVACEGVLQSPPSGTRDNLLSMPLKPTLLPPECLTQSLKRHTFHTATKTEMVSTVSTSRESIHSQLIATSSTKCFPTQQTYTFPFREHRHVSMDTHTHSVTTFASALHNTVYLAFISRSPTLLSEYDSSGRTMNPSTSQSTPTINLVGQSTISQRYLPLTLVQTAPPWTKEHSRRTSIMEPSQLTLDPPGDTRAQLSQSAQKTMVKRTTMGKLVGPDSVLTSINLEHPERTDPIYTYSHLSAIVPASHLSLLSAVGVPKQSSIILSMKSISASQSIYSMTLLETPWPAPILLETLRLHSIYPSLVSETPRLESILSTGLLDNITKQSKGTPQSPCPLSKGHGSLTASRLAEDTGPALLPTSTLEGGQSKYSLDLFGNNTGITETMKEPETHLSDTSTPHLHQLLTVPGQDLTKSHLSIWLGSKLTQPATKSLQFIHERSLTMSSLTEQQRQTFMLSSLEKSRTKSASPLEGSTLTPNLPSLAMFLKLELEKTISHTTSLPFNLERSMATVSQSENGRLVSTPQQVDLNRLTSTFSRVNGRQLAFDKTPVTTYVSSPLYLYEDLPRVPLTHSGQLVTVLAVDHRPKTHSVQITAGPLGDRPGSQTIDLSQKTQHTGAQSIASPSQVPLLSPISAKQSWQMESNMTLEPSLTQIPLAAPATSELYSEITSVPRTELYVDSVLFMMTPTTADFESNFDSSYSIPQATVEILGTTAHGQLWPIELSAVQRLYTESSLPLLQSLDPSYPQYIQSIAQENTLGNSTQTFPTDSLDFMSQSAEKEQTPLPSKFSDLEIRDHYSDPVYIQTDTSRQFSSESHKDRPQTAAITDKNSEYVSLQFPSKTNQLVTATSFSSLHSSQSLPSISVTTQTSSIPASVLSATNRSAVSSMHQSLPRTQGITSMGRAITVCPITGYCPLTSILILSTGWREYDTTSSVSSGPVEMREVSLGLAPTGVLRASSAPMSPSAASSGPSNLPPKVLQSIPLLEATVGFPFHYTIPSRTFLDPEDGAAESLSLELTFIDGPPVTLGSWVALDGLELHGVPLEVDLQFAPQQLLLAARDNQGLAAWLPLTLDLHRSHAEPCHSFSLIAHRSLYSLLSQRHRVELLLDKLSRFFNDSGSHHLAVLSLAPGSTIVSWYNFTLCQVGGDGDEGRCPVGQVWRMWEEISSEARQSSPAFSQAMLPEFPISKVGPVSFRRDCFSSATTATTIASSPTLSPSTPYPTSINTVPASDPTGASVRQTDPYHWMASVLTALLVVCCLFLAVTVTFIVFYFCRSCVRVRTLAIWPSEGVVPGHTMDLRAIRPRMPPLFQPEVHPPPPRLWLNTSPASGEHLSPTYLQGRQPYQRPVSFHPPPQY